MDKTVAKKPKNLDEGGQKYNKNQNDLSSSVRNAVSSVVDGSIANKMRNQDSNGVCTLGEDNNFNSEELNLNQAEKDLDSGGFKENLKKKNIDGLVTSALSEALNDSQKRSEGLEVPDKFHNEDFPNGKGESAVSLQDNAISSEKAASSWLLSFGLPLLGGATWVAFVLLYRFGIEDISSYAMPPKAYELGVWALFAFLPAFMFFVLARIFAAASLVGKNQNSAINSNNFDGISKIEKSINQGADSVNDSVEWAVSRAKELELAVSNEVSLLESFYVKNEESVKSILTEMKKYRKLLTGDVFAISKEFSKHGNTLVSQAKETVTFCKSELEATVNEVSQGIESSVDKLSGKLLDYRKQTKHELQHYGDDLAANISTINDKAREEFSGMTGNMEAEYYEFGAKLVDNLESQHNKMIASVQAQAEKSNSSLDDNLNQLRNMYEQYGKQIVDDLFTKSSLVGAALKSTGEQVSESVSLHVDKVTKKLDAAENNLNVSVKENSDNLVKRLQEEHERLENLVVLMGSEVADKVANSTELFADTAVSKSEEICEHISSAVDALGLVFDGRGEDVVQLIDNKMNAVSDKLEQNAHEVNNRLDNTLSKMTGLVQKEGTELANSLENSLSRMENVVEQGGDKLSNAVANNALGFAKEIKGYVSSIERDLNDQLRQVLDSIRRGTGKFNSGVELKVQKASELIDNRLVEIADVFDKRVEDIGVAVDTRVEQINKSLADQIISMVNQITKRHKDVAASVNDVVNMTNVNLIKTKESLLSEISSKMSQVTTELENCSKASVESVGGTSVDVSKKLEEVSKDLAKKAANVISQVAYSLEKESSSFFNEIEEKFDARLLSAGSMIEKSTGDLKVYLNNMENLVDQKAPALTSRFAQIQGAMDKTITEDGEILVGSIEQLTTKFNSTVDEFFKSGISEIEAGTEAISEKMMDDASSHIKAIRSKLASDASKLSRMVGESIASCCSDLVSSIDKSTFEVKGVMDEVSKTLNAQVSQVNGTLNEAGKDFDSILQKRITSLENVVESGTEIVSNLEQKTGVLANTFTECNDRLSSTLDASSGSVSTAVITAGEKFRQTLITGSQDAVEKVTEVLSNFDNLGKKLQSAVQSSTESISQINKELSNNVDGLSDLAEGIETVSEKAGSLLVKRSAEFSESASEARSAIGSVAQVFEQQANNLTNSLSQVKVDSEEVREILGNKFDDVVKMSDSWAAKFRDIEANLERISDIMDNRASKIENSILAVRSSADEHTKKITELVNLELQSIPATADEVGKKATKVVANAGKILIDDMTSSLTNTSDKFNKATDDMRLIAKELRVELNEARDEISRAALELSYSAMRSGKDIREITRSQNISENKDNNLISSGFVQESDKIASGSDLNSENVDKKITGSKVSKTKLSDIGLVDLGLDNLGDEARKSNSKPVSNMFSGDIELDSLQKLSSQIVLAVKVKELEDVWVSFFIDKVGHPNLGNNIYTKDGARLRELIRAKYKENSNFKNTVDAYVNDFNEFLTSIPASKNSSDIRFYVLSDAGMVYSVLADISDFYRDSV